jgi:murein L,D-transpeptidase YcbB/YkuD
LKASYWLVTVTAVALTAAVWLRLAGVTGPSAKLESDLTTAALAPAEAPVTPPSPALNALRAMLPQVAARAEAEDRAAMTEFYAQRSGSLLWVSESGFSDKADATIAELREADDWGLRADDFALPQRPDGVLSPQAQAEAEIALTLAVLKYARHARGGRLRDPSRIAKVLDHTPPVRAPKLVLADIAAAAAPDQYLRDLHPKHEQFVKLRALLLKLRRGDGSDAEIAYGASLQAAVPGLQAPPRVLNPRTAADIDRILANMERWRWMPVDLGTLYVWNNVPEFMTRVLKNDKVINSDRIVAGQPDWPTPSFSGGMKTIVFHPSWGVPDGIKRKELLPLLRNSSGGGLIGLFTGAPSSRAVLEAHKLQAYHNGRPIDPNQVDWGSANIAAYEFRQPPGPANVLGAVKFLFPNKHDVYMHDTPDRSLFARSFRGLSHGCMRVGDPRRLAEVLLAEDKGWSKEKVASLFAGGTSEVQLDTTIPVHTTYFTAMVDFKGNLRTFGDLYGLDARVGAALLGRKVRFGTPRYDDEILAIKQEERRQRTRPTAGSPTLADAIADIFSP